MMHYNIQYLHDLFSLMTCTQHHVGWKFILQVLPWIYIYLWEHFLPLHFLFFTWFCQIFIPREFLRPRKFFIWDGMTLLKKWPCSELFWSTFSRIRTEIRRDTSYLTVFSPNAGKCGLEQQPIRTLFTQWMSVILASVLKG